MEKEVEPVPVLSTVKDRSGAGVGNGEFRQARG
jgi:hypothetical protein